MKPLKNKIVLPTEETAYKFVSKYISDKILSHINIHLVVGVNSKVPSKI